MKKFGKEQTPKENKRFRFPGCLQRKGAAEQVILLNNVVIDQERKLSCLGC